MRGGRGAEARGGGMRIDGGTAARRRRCRRRQGAHSARP